MQKHKRNILVLVSVVVAVMVIVSPCALLLLARVILDQPFILSPSPPSFFRKVVLDPIPESVKDIRFDRFRRFSEYRWIMRFDLDKSDLSLIIDSGPFRRYHFSSIMRSMGKSGLARVGGKRTLCHYINLLTNGRLLTGFNWDSGKVPGHICWNKRILKQCAFWCIMKKLARHILLTINGGTDEQENYGDETKHVIVVILFLPKDNYA